MKKQFFFILLLLFSINGSAQTLFGIGTQWNNSGKWQFKTTFNDQLFEKSETSKLLSSAGSPFSLAWGIDFTAGKNTVAFNAKPLVINYKLPFLKKMREANPLSLGLDVGYNLNVLDKNRYSVYGENGIIVSPNFTIDIMVATVQTGYEYNTFHNNGMFYVRVIVGPTMNFIKTSDKFY